MYGDDDKKKSWVKAVFWILLVLMLLFTVLPMLGLFN